MNKTTKNSMYEDIPYPENAYPQSHPQHLATLASLFEMMPCDIHQARILELGCANGSNLIPMASQFPNARFVGIESSPRQAQSAQKLIADLNLSNITVQEKNILQIDADIGHFDYIIAHGVYSWVTPDVQEKLLFICKNNLSKNGVAYVSYNTNPGWKMRGMVRDIMLYHTANVSDPHTKIQQSRDLIQFLSNSVSTKNNPYGAWLKQEFQHMNKWKDDYFFHDSLEAVNEPLYFHQFIEHITQQELEYLGDAEFSSMLTSNFSAEEQEKLQQLGSSQVAREQYMDYMRNRMFRCSLICHKDIKLKRQISPERLKDFYILSHLKVVSTKPDITSMQELEFQGKDGKITSTQPLIKAAMLYLSQQFPLPVAFDEVLHHAYSLLGIDESKITDPEIIKRNEIKLGSVLLNCFSKKLVELSIYPPLFTTKINTYPQTTALIRLQAKKGTVTNLQHKMVHLDKVTQLMLPYLDGKHNHEALLKILDDKVKAGKITVQDAETTLKDKEQLQLFLQKCLNTFLSNCVRGALLLASSNTH